MGWESIVIASTWLIARLLILWKGLTRHLEGLFELIHHIRVSALHALATIIYSFDPLYVKW